MQEIDDALDSETIVTFEGCQSENIAKVFSQNTHRRHLTFGSPENSLGANYFAVHSLSSMPRLFPVFATRPTRYSIKREIKGYRSGERVIDERIESSSDVNFDDETDALKIKLTTAINAPA